MSVYSLLWVHLWLHWRRKWQPTPVLLPRESQGWGAWWAAVYGVAQSQTQLKWLSSSSSNAHIVPLGIGLLPFLKKKESSVFVFWAFSLGSFYLWPLVSPVTQSFSFTITLVNAKSPCHCLMKLTCPPLELDVKFHPIHTTECGWMVIL